MISPAGGDTRSPRSYALLERSGPARSLKVVQEDLARSGIDCGSPLGSRRGVVSHWSAPERSVSPKHARHGLRTRNGRGDGARRCSEARHCFGRYTVPEKGLYFRFFQWLIRHHARDLRAMEAIVSVSGLAWTIARPPRFDKVDGCELPRLRDALPPGRPRAMSFRSVAAFLLDAVQRKSHVSEIVPDWARPHENPVSCPCSCFTLWLASWESARSSLSPSSRQWRGEDAAALRRRSPGLGRCSAPPG